jgi:hypothetical protein
MHFDTDRSVPTLNDVHHVLLNASAFEDLAADARSRVADEMGGCVVGALLHGATLPDLRADLHPLLTVVYGVAITTDDCEELARDLLDLTSSPTQRW